MKHRTSSLQLCSQPTVLRLTQSTTDLGAAAGACVPQPDSWRRPAEVAPYRRVGTFPTGGHRWSGQAVASRSSSLRSSTRWTFWTQTLGVLKTCHSHGRTLDNQSRLCLYSGHLCFSVTLLNLLLQMLTDFAEIWWLICNLTSQCWVEFR